jgi:hypothetical protein
MKRLPVNGKLYAGKYLTITIHQNGKMLITMADIMNEGKYFPIFMPEYLNYFKLTQVNSSKLPLCSILGKQLSF